MKRFVPGALLVSGLITFVACGEGASSPGSTGSASSSGGGQGGNAGAGGGSAGNTPDSPPLINPSQYNTVLGRPTDSSIAISVLAAAAGDKAYIEYSAQINETLTDLITPQKTNAVASTAGEPIVVDITGLAKNTKYYYRVHYQVGGQGDTADNLHSFRTQRSAGSTFHFGVQGDTHPERAGKMFHAELFTLTMEQVRDHQPDLYFMLGDDFSIEKIIQNFKGANYPAGHTFLRAVEGVAPYTDYQTLAKPFSQQMITDGKQAPQSNAAYLEMRQKYLGLMANATPLMLVNGNHEQAHLANIGGIFNNASIWAADARLKYYPLPAPGGFYTGDETKMTPMNGYTTIEAGDGLLRDYYAFTWGDALFVTIDPYWHSATISPDSTLFADPEPLWGATLGNEQYAWLKKTLETSTAKWKFVFAHHINGNNRGAAAIVERQEWGGELGFAQNRPGWDKPIHQLFADTKVTVFFQGHDHMYARERVDGVVYQEVPNPGDHSYFAYNCDAYAPATITWSGPAGYGVYEPDYSVRMPDTGFLDVTVSPDSVQIDYIRTYRAIDLQTNPNKIFTGNEKNGEVAFSYSIPPKATDNQAKDFAYTCIGAAPPAGWVYNP